MIRDPSQESSESARIRKCCVQKEDVSIVLLISAEENKREQRFVITDKVKSYCLVGFSSLQKSKGTRFVDS